MAKQSKPNKTTDTNEKLSPIEEQLLECCEKREPVFLYGGSTANDLENLINKIRDMWVDVYLKGGNGNYWEPPINCEYKQGKEIYETLVGSIGSDGTPSRDGLLFRCKKLIFLYNLHCRNDDEYYIKLAEIISKHKSKNKHIPTVYKDGKHLSESFLRKNVFVSAPLPTIFEWFVVHTYNDIKCFPPQFQKRFKVISLSPESKDEQQNKETAFAQDLSPVEAKDKYVFRKDSERWYIRFESEVLKPENLDGFEYIHYLIENKKKQITPKRLYQAVKGVKISNKDEDDSLQTYSVQTKTIEKAQHGELKNHHSNDEMMQFANELRGKNKNDVKKIVEVLRKDKENLINRKSELEEEGRFSEIDDIKNDIKDVQEQIDLATRKEYNPEHKQFYDLVYKAIEKAREKIKRQSIKNNYKSLLTWNHFKDSIVYSDFRYSYRPTTPISWNL